MNIYLDLKLKEPDVKRIDMPYFTSYPTINEDLLNSLNKGDLIWLHGLPYPVSFIERRKGDYQYVTTRYDVIDYYKFSGSNAVKGEYPKATSYSWTVIAKVTESEKAEYVNVLEKTLNFFK